MQVGSVEAIVKALNQAKVQYLIVGGLAVNAHGYVRLTRDLDLVISLKKMNVLAAMGALAELGYQVAIPVKAEEFAEEHIREQWRRERNMIVLKLWSDAHQRTPVDIFIYEPFEFAAEIGRATEREIYPGLFAKVVTLETLCEMKRAAGRPQDLTDIAELRRLQ